MAEQRRPPRLRRITYDKWEKKFRPLKKHDHGSGDLQRFETFGTEVALVAKVDPQHVWTMLDCDGKWYLINGRHHVNRLFYMITEIPWQPDDQYSIRY